MQAILDSMEINSEPTITYSEEVYKSLLKEHKLDEESNDALSFVEDEDPLALNSSDIIQQTQDNISQAKTSAKEFNKSQIYVQNTHFVEIKNEPYEGFPLEEQLSHDQMKNQTEVIKIEIVKDEDGLCDSQGISNEDYLQLTESKHEPSSQKDYFLLEMSPPCTPSTSLKDGPATKQTNKFSGKDQVVKTLKKNLVQQNKQPQQNNKDEENIDPPLEYMDLSQSVELRMELPVSYKDLSAMELDFNYDFNCKANSNAQKLISFTGTTSDILDVCEKCVENALYNMEQITDAKNIRLKIILVLMKLKTNFRCKILATVLGLEENICGKIFCSALDILFVSLKSAICWFTGKELKNGKAKCFEDDVYNRIRVILVKFMFKVNKCQKSQCDVNLCEQYKKHEFVKVIIGLSPKGHLVSYVTNTYDAHISMATVLRKEKFFSHLCNQGDVVVLVLPKYIEIPIILEDCRRLGILLKTLDQMSQDVQDYVGDTLKKLATFEILRKREINSHMVPLIGKSIAVICGVLNLTSEAENINELSSVT